MSSRARQFSILDFRSSILNPRSSVAVRMMLVMLPEQVIAVVVPVRSPAFRRNRLAS
jgi:hypothetical protein